MEKIYLQGGTLQITEKDKVYQVEKGHVLVYLMPYVDGKPGRRLFLRECCEGEEIPGFFYENSLLGSWCIGLTALDKAEICVDAKEISEELKLSFAERINLTLWDAEEYEEQLVEKYNLNLVKEEGYIYATATEQENTYEKSLRIIYNLFRKKRFKSKQVTPESGHKLYDTVAYLCDYLEIPMVSFSNLKENCGRRFALDDISRMSHFITREVVLEENWYKRDSGPLLVYRKEGKKPLACIPKSPKCYVAYDVTEQSAVVVDEKLARELEPKAMMFYRPFPDKAMKAKDLFLFGLKSVYVSDILRFIDTL